MWVLTKIDPTTFNAVSDLIAKVVAGLLLATLGVVYPQMVWTSIKRCNGVDLDVIITPPGCCCRRLVSFAVHEARGCCS